MKTTNSFLFALMFLCHLSLSAQEDKKAPVKPVVSDVFIQTGTFSQFTSNAPLTDFNKLAPGSDMLARLNSGYNYHNGGMMFNSSSSFSMMTGIRFPNAEKDGYKMNPVFRIGINYQSGTYLSMSMGKTERKRYDTLTSSQTGDQVFVDSVYNDYYNAQYGSENLGLEASLIFRTDPQSRWSLYGGFGVTAGLSLNAYTTISHATESHEETDGNRSFNTGYSYESQTVRIANKPNFGFGAFLPVGVDFRMGKKRDFWKRTHLYYEMRPAVNFLVIPELNTRVNASLSQNLGVRIAIN